MRKNATGCATLSFDVNQLLLGVIAFLLMIAAGALGVPEARAGAGGLPTPLARKLLHPNGPAYEGSGCPTGSGGVSVSFSPDGRALSILFNDFRAEVTATGGKPILDSRYCVIRVPVQVPAGYALSVVSADYRGFAYIVGQQTAGRVTSSVKLTTLKKPVSDAIDWKLQTEPEDFFFTHAITPSQNNRLLCSEARPNELLIRVDLQLRSHDTRGELAMLTLDSIDSGSTEDDGGIHYGLDWQPCSAKR